MRNFQKRKPSPLQEWKAQYKYVSNRIKTLKKNTRQGHVWGQFKVPKQQSFLVMMKAEATEMMFIRDFARDEARRLAEIKA
jgi:hypothetical protein